MSSAERIKWEEAHRGKPAGGELEPFVIEMMPLLPRGGLVLDVAAGRDRHAIALAGAGMRVVAADFSEASSRTLADYARANHLVLWPLLADFDNFALRDRSLDAIVNINFLDRALFPTLARALKPGGVLLAETFLIDQAQIGHPTNPRFLLRHHELRELVGDLELMRYREGLVVYPDGTRAWRAGVLARRNC